METEGAEAIANDYKLTLADLNCNSKLHINVLTILAEENIKYAAAIVQTIMKHLETTPPESKLPILYLIDSIIKNVGSEYLKIFSQHIISIFASVFQKVDEPTRVLMYKLRQTWSNIFNNKILYGLDVKTKQVDPAWPITAEQPPAQSIHINPKFLGSNTAAASSSKTAQVSIIQKDDDVAKAEREAVLKQLLVKGVVEQKKRELNAKVSQKIESKPTSFVQLSPIQTIPAADPRSAAKLRALQADPRIVRVAPIKKPSVLPASTNVDVSNTRTAAPVKAPVTVPSVVSVVKKKSNIPSEVKTTLKDVPNDRTKDDKVPESSSRNNEKRTENVFSGRNPVKLKSDTHISAVQKSDSYNNSSKDKNSSGKKKKKFDENKLSEKDKVPITNEAKITISPRKSKEKNTEKKKINSREKKSSSHSPRSPVDDKKHLRQRSRSPMHKSEKKSPNRSSPKRHTSGRDTRLRKQSVDEEKRKLNFDLRNGKEEEDTDLRLRYTNSEVDRGKKVVKRESDDEKRETSGEPPEKKPREDKENENENDNDSILGATDQDYRIPPNQKSSEYKGWATYKAAHPEEFKTPLRQSRESIDSNQSVFDEYRNNSSNEKPYSKSPTESYNSPLTPQTEYDRLGRPRLYIRKMLQRSDSFYGAYLRRDEDFMGSPNSSHRQWHELFRRSDTTDILRQVEEKFQLGTISKADLDDIRQYFKYKDYGLRRQLPSGDDFKDLPYTRRSDLEFKNSPEHILNEQHHPQQSDESLIVQGPDVKPLPVADFRLDNQSRKVHFVDDKAFIVNDDNEPREITFQGSPTPVYIEGLKPILLQFDGKPVNFELDGRVCSMKFGVPFRELFINNYPYKGQFGGPPFLAMLDNRQVYRISLGGPTPKVEIGQQPAYELQQKFHAQNNNDVDFRHKSNTEKFNDMDWRHIAQPSNAQHDQRPDNQSVNTESHSYEFYRPKSGFDEREFRSGPDNVYSKEHQKMQEWEPEYRPPTSQAVESVGPRLSEWTQPPFRDVQMANSPRNTPPHDGPPHPNEWGPPPRPFNPNRVNPPNGPWVPENFGPSGPTHVRPPRPELIHNSQQEPPLQHYDRTHYPEYYDNTKGPFNFRNPSRPPFNTRQPSRMFNDKPILRPRLGPPPPLLFPRPPMQPWMRHPRMLHPTENRHPTLLPPPPQPPILRMPSSVIRPETSVSSAAENATVPMASVPGIPPSPAVPSLNAPSSFIQPAVVTPASSEAVPPVVIPATAPVPAPNIDISTLFEKLLAAGVISKPTSEVPVLPEKPVDEIKKEETESDKKEDSEKEPAEEVIPSIEMKVECLKVKYPGVTNALYKGSQCASCGMRFKEIHGERYSRHLDWHFRMNRREKDGVKKAFSRKWYYEVEDWIQFEEFEDFEERARSFFELQADEQFQMEAAIELPSVPASGQEAESCVVCGEAFFLFWVEEEEEWHLRNAVRHDEQAYHPSCYEDFIKASREPETPVNKDDSIKSEGDIKEEADIKKEPMDEVEVIVNEEPLPSTPVIKTEDISSEIIETLEKLMEDVLLKEEAAETEDVSLNEEAAESENVQASEESPEIKLEGKPGEEEVIGLISESDMETDVPPQEESEKVVFQSGGIIMKVRAESLKPASPAPDNTIEKGASTKEVVEESEEEEFRPPTPDPRFQVLPPVQRGTELSGLCTIM